MGTEKRFWDFLIDFKKPLKRSEYKKAILRGQLTLLAISVGLTYIVIDYLNGIYFNILYYLILIFFSVFTLLLNRRGNFKVANFVFLVLLNTLIYIFASNDTYRSGVYMYFMVCALTSLTLCGYEQLRTGLFFTALSLLLFFLAYILKVYPWMPHAEVPESYVSIAFITNFTVSLATTTTLLFFLLDINHKAEKELEENNQLLTKTNKELDHFVYSASHDLRSPLSSMLGLVGIAKKSTDPEEIKLCLDLMTDRINVQESFIHDIIDYARNSRVSVSREEIRMKPFVLEIVEHLKHHEDAQKIDFRIEMSDEVTIKGDRTRLNSVLANLISNAIKYHDTTKANQFIRIELGASEHTTEIWIEDNGQGIHPNFHQKIFDMFFRASEASKGSGLGLFIVKETLQKMNGKISVQSEVGKGSCFFISLPIL